LTPWRQLELDGGIVDPAIGGRQRRLDLEGHRIAEEQCVVDVMDDDVAFACRAVIGIDRLEIGVEGRVERVVGLPAATGWAASETNRTAATTAASREKRYMAPPRARPGALPLEAGRIASVASAERHHHETTDRKRR